MENIIEKIQNAMKGGSVTEQWIADQTGIPQPTVHRIVTGQSKKLDLVRIRKITDVLGVSEQQASYGVTQVIEGLTPEEYEMIMIARKCPEAVAVVRMMGAVDSDTQKDIQRGTEKEKLMFDLKKERRERRFA